MAIKFKRPEPFQLYRYFAKTKVFYIRETKARIGLGGDGDWEYDLTSHPNKEVPELSQKYVATQEMAKEVLLQMFYEVENRQARDSDLKVSGPNMFGYFGRKMTYKAVFNSDRGKWELSLKWALEPVSGVGRYNKIRDAIKHYAEYIRDISEECEELN